MIFCITLVQWVGDGIPNISDSVVMGSVNEIATCSACDATNVRVMKCQELDCVVRFCEICGPISRLSIDVDVFQLHRFDSGEGNGPYCKDCISKKDQEHQAELDRCYAEDAAHDLAKIAELSAKHKANYEALTKIESERKKAEQQREEMNLLAAKRKWEQSEIEITELRERFSHWKSELTTYQNGFLYRLNKAIKVDYRVSFVVFIALSGLAILTIVTYFNPEYHFDEYYRGAAFSVCFVSVFFFVLIREVFLPDPDRSENYRKLQAIEHDLLNRLKNLGAYPAYYDPKYAPPVCPLSDKFESPSFEDWLERTKFFDKMNKGRSYPVQHFEWHTLQVGDWIWLEVAAADFYGEIIDTEEDGQTTILTKEGKRIIGETHLIFTIEDYEYHPHTVLNPT